MNSNSFWKVGDKIEMIALGYEGSIFEIIKIDNDSKTFTIKCLKAEGRAKTFFKVGKEKIIVMSLYYEFKKINNYV